MVFIIAKLLSVDLEKFCDDISKVVNLILQFQLWLLFITKLSLILYIAKPLGSKIQSLIF